MSIWPASASNLLESIGFSFFFRLSISRVKILIGNLDFHDGIDVVRHVIYFSRCRPPAAGACKHLWKQGVDSQQLLSVGTEQNEGDVVSIKKTHHRSSESRRFSTYLPSCVVEWDPIHEIDAKITAEHFLSTKQQNIMGRNGTLNIHQPQFIARNFKLGKSFSLVYST